MTSVGAPAAAVPVRGGTHPHLRDGHAVALFSAVFVGLLLLGLVAILLVGHAGPRAACAGEPVCRPVHLSPRLVRAVTWSSPVLGFGIEYDREAWELEASDSGPEEVVLKEQRGSGVLRVEGARGHAVESLFARRLDALRDTYRDLVPNSARGKLLGINIGYVDRGAMGAELCGRDKITAERVDVVVMAATSGRITLVASLTSDDCDAVPVDTLAFQEADTVLNTLRWEPDR